MDRIERNEWRAVREHGRARFIWRSGMLGFGAPLAVAMLVADAVGHAIGLSPVTSWTAKIVAGCVGALVSGAFFGWMMWTVRERAFLKEVRRGFPVIQPNQDWDETISS